MHQDRLAVSVREGSVQLEGPNVSVTVRKGEIKTLRSNGEFSQGSVGAFDEQWSWATEIAPVVQLSGQSWFEQAHCWGCYMFAAGLALLVWAFYRHVIQRRSVAVRMD